MGTTRDEVPGGGETGDHSEYLTKPLDRKQLRGVLEKYRCNSPPCSVLVVEDDVEIRTLLRQLLAREGWDVTEAENGRVGLDVVARMRPELILLDLMMPVMDGFEFLLELRRSPAGRSIPVVVLTAMDLGESELRQLKGQVSHILQKGAYTREELLNEVRDLVNDSLIRERQ